MLQDCFFLLLLFCFVYLFVCMFVYVFLFVCLLFVSFLFVKEDEVNRYIFSSVQFQNNRLYGNKFCDVFVLIKRKIKKYLGETNEELSLQTFYRICYCFPSNLELESFLHREVVLSPLGNYIRVQTCAQLLIKHKLTVPCSNLIPP